jgi:hypothetical protein
MGKVDAELTGVAAPEGDLDLLQAEVGRDASPARTRDEVASRAGPRHSPAAETAQILPYPRPGTAAAGARTVTMPARRLVRRALRWYLWPVTSRMTTHNHAVDGVLTEQARQLARISMELERTEHDLELLDLRGP